uniref:Uncharacterized protein n=1 Tax=Anguilla anguilla TaxID=7936 RepID=A0A0E9U9T0_ANGAN
MQGGGDRAKSEPSVTVSFQAVVFKEPTHCFVRCRRHGFRQTGQGVS